MRNETTLKNGRRISLPARCTTVRELVERMTELLCDLCGRTMGHVDEFDLNGSWFACAECREKVLKGEL